MKDLIQNTIALFFIAIAALLPITGFYLLWSWSMHQIPFGFAWSGLAKIGVTILLIMTGGTMTALASILVAVFAASFAIVLLEK